jgi:siroheme synthase (precorrin-2 oxidase/ferrochelatase)
MVDIGPVVVVVVVMVLLSCRLATRPVVVTGCGSDVVARLPHFR